MPMTWDTDNSHWTFPCSICEGIITDLDIAGLTAGRPFCWRCLDVGHALEALGIAMGRFVRVVEVNALVRDIHDRVERFAVASTEQGRLGAMDVFSISQLIDATDKLAQIAKSSGPCTGACRVTSRGSLKP